MWLVYHFLSQRGLSVINEWLDQEKVAKQQRAVFGQKIDALEQGGPEMVPGLIFGPIAKDIYKLKIKGNKGWVQLRPLLCRGPFGEREFTLLLGAIERNSRLEPLDAIRRARDNRELLLENPGRRRRDRIA